MNSNDDDYLQDRALGPLNGAQMARNANFVNRQKTFIDDEEYKQEPSSSVRPTPQPRYTKNMTQHAPQQHKGFASQKNKLAYGNTLVPSFNAAAVGYSGDQNSNHHMRHLNKQLTDNGSAFKIGLINQVERTGGEAQRMNSNRNTEGGKSVYPTIPDEEQSQINGMQGRMNREKNY
ncbi:hypothetical protein FGO68_gene12431 [Halteria grandinella]|uniref:Uncharacterized protein n=1 Tax=Halteria grandinella TaxID=5974 RepID=A0A8J8P6Y5_HALGN|nr:hypothetical protein FGO68_gene12431 [Halteria grandinella]